MLGVKKKPEEEGVEINVKLVECVCDVFVTMYVGIFMCKGWFGFEGLKVSRFKGFKVSRFVVLAFLLRIDCCTRAMLRQRLDQSHINIIQHSPKRPIPLTDYAPEDHPAHNSSLASTPPNSPTLHTAASHSGQPRCSTFLRPPRKRLEARGRGYT